MLQDSPNLKELDKQDKDVTILKKILESALELKTSKGHIYLGLKRVKLSLMHSIPLTIWPLYCSAEKGGDGAKLVLKCLWRHFHFFLDFFLHSLVL
jgi:hypothetical protein